MRTVTEEIGRMVFEADSQRAKHRLDNMHQIEDGTDAQKRKGTLYPYAKHKFSQDEKRYVP